MHIAGLQKTTLLDFPGRVASTGFVRGCNFRCPVCQNGEILTLQGEEYSRDELFAFLKKRKGVLDGVCVTGGEPLLQADTPQLLSDIKALGYAIKLDTNGAFPDALKALAADGLIDFVAMDIKNSPAKYDKTAGVSCNIRKIEESAAFLLEGTLDYEFRTTVVKQLHRAEDFIRIGQWLKGAKRYFLQNFRASESVLDQDLSPCSDEELQTFKDLLKPFIPSVKIRGEGE